MSYNNYDNANTPYEMDRLPQSNGYQDQGMIAFFAEIDQIKKDLVQFNDNIDRIEETHKRSLVEVSGDSDADWARKQLDLLVDETRSLANDLRNQIKTLQSKSAHDRTKADQAEAVKAQFMKSITKYQNIEASFRQKIREVEERQIRIVRPDATDAEVQEALDDRQGQSQIFAEAMRTSDRRGQQKAVLSEVQSRHQEVQKIEQTMTELAQLFRDMEMMVVEQEEAVSYANNQVSTAQHDIETGLAQTDKAVKSARRARKMRWILFVIILIIIIVIVVPIATHFAPSSK